MNVVVRFLAVYRLTRLVVRDKLTEDWRKAIQKRSSEKVAYLFGCPWCASIWLAPLVVVPAVLFPRSRLVRAGCEVLAGSAIAGLAAAWLDPPEDEGVLLEDIDPEPDDEATWEAERPVPAVSALVERLGGPAIPMVAVQMVGNGVHWEHCSLDADHPGPCR